MQPPWRQDTSGRWFYYDPRRDRLVYRTGLTTPRPPNVPRSMYLDPPSGRDPRQLYRSRPEQRTTLGRRSESQEESDDSSDSPAVEDGGSDEEDDTRISSGNRASGQHDQPRRSSIARAMTSAEQQMRQLQVGASSLNPNYTLSTSSQSFPRENSYQSEQSGGSSSNRDHSFWYPMAPAQRATTPPDASNMTERSVVGQYYLSSEPKASQRIPTPPQGATSSRQSSSRPSLPSVAPSTSPSSSRFTGSDESRAIFEARINGKAARGSFDPTIQRNFVSMDFMRNNKLFGFARPIQDKATSAGTRWKSSIPQYTAELDLLLKGDRYRKSFFVVSDIAQDLILGENFIREEEIEVRYWKRDPEKVKEDQSRSRQERADEARALQNRQLAESSTTRAQSAAAAWATQVGYWRSMYNVALNRGMTPAQAMDSLVQQFLVQNPGSTQDRALQHIRAMLAGQ